MQREKRGFQNLSNNPKVIPYLYLSPFLLLFLIFMVYPIIHSFYLSLFEFKGIKSSTFIGFNNYIQLLKDQRFRMALFNTVYFSFGMVFLTLFVSFPLSLILSSNTFPGSKVFRLIYFLPILTSLIVAGAIFKLIFLDSGAGLLNSILSFIGIGPKKWLLDGFWAINSVLVMAFWRRMGLNIMYFVAGLQSLPHDIYESAMMDGATPWQKLKYITIPMMKPIISFVLIITLIYAFLAFDEIFVLNPAGSMDSPQNNMVTMGYHLYESGFQLFKFGYGSAIGFMITLIILLFSTFQLKLLGVIDSDK